MVPKALAGDRGVLQNIKLAKELYRVFSGAHMGSEINGGNRSLIMDTDRGLPIYS